MNMYLYIMDTWGSHMKMTERILTRCETQRPQAEYSATNGCTWLYIHKGAKVFMNSLFIINKIELLAIPPKYLSALDF